MKVVQVNVTDEKGGGAARCAFNLFEGLEQHGVDSWMFVMDKNGSHEKVKGPENLIEHLYNRLLILLNLIGIRIWYRGKTGGHTLGIFPNPFFRRLLRMRPDVVHIHASACSFVPISFLKLFRCPIVWTFHDLWPMVGGAHHPVSIPKCYFNDSIEDRCTEMNPGFFDKWLWRVKLRNWGCCPIQVITPSEWMRNWVLGSLIFDGKPVQRIPNAIDTRDFRKAASGKKLREKMGISVDTFVILFGANKLVTDSNKGLGLVLEALVGLDNPSRSVHVVFYGANTILKPELPVESTVLGPIEDYDKMIALYSMADVFLMASIFENLPFSVMESMACECPVVSVSVGGIPELIRHEKEGYLMAERSPQEMLLGVRWALNHPDWKSVMRSARRKIETEYSMNVFVESHLNLYRELKDLVE